MVLNSLIVDVESETLLNKERKPKSLRALVAGAAAASFLLGLVAATAVSTVTNPAAPAAAPAALRARSAPPAALHAKKPRTSTSKRKTSSIGSGTRTSATIFLRASPHGP